jgi:coenzyme Q-binding protein COQ10
MSTRAREARLRPVGGGAFHVDDTMTVAAPIGLVYDVVSDFTRYPEFIGDVVSASMEGDLCLMTLRVGPVVMPLRTRVERRPPEAVAFVLVDGPVRRLEGRWMLEANGTTTTVRLEVEVDAGALGPWITRIAGKLADRYIEKVEAAFRDRVAALSPGSAGWREP